MNQTVLSTGKFDEFLFAMTAKYLVDTRDAKEFALLSVFLADMEIEVASPEKSRF